MRSNGSGIKRYMAIAVIIMTIITSSPAMAAKSYTVKTNKLVVYAKKSKKSKVIFTLKKGATVKLKSAGKKWYAVKANGKVGYALKANVKSAKAKNSANSKKAAVNKKKLSTKNVQDKLVKLGYLKSSNATGAINAATKKAVRVFKAFVGMKVNSKLNAAARKKIIAAKKSKPDLSAASWSGSKIGSYFKKRGKATIVDLATGKRLTIRRVGGHNHLDVEPATAKDTKVLKKVYGGTWSWDSKAILLKAKNHYYAAAMNGMPHGTQISKSNNFKGQFCVHLKGCTTHGTEKSNSLHQSNVAKAYAYLTGAA